MRSQATPRPRVGDACFRPGCAGRLRALAPEDRAAYVAAHPFTLSGPNAQLLVGACDACGADVIGLQPETEETPTA